MLKAFGADISVGGEMGRHISVRPGFTLNGQNVVVPGDISSAAFWLVAGALIPGADLTIENVGLNPTRTGILEVLEQMGAQIEVLNPRDVAGEPVGDLRVTHGPLKPFHFGEEIMPRLVDEVPILSVAACFCDGESRISGASELRVKETDRLAVMARQLKAMGAAELMSPGTTTFWPFRVEPGRTLMCRPISPPTLISAPNALSIRSL